MPRKTHVAVLALIFPLLCAAQDGLLSPPSTEAPVEFPAEAAELGMFTGMANKVFRPAGRTGALPAVVIGHTCGGVSRPHIRDRAKELLAAGYLVVTVDSYGPRGVSECRGQSRVDQRTQVRDAYAALEHLAKMPGVDAKRVYYTGYSSGGMAAALLASPYYAPQATPAPRFGALVSNYTSCIYQYGPATRRVQLLAREIDTPILMLMASEDKELRASDCLPQLEQMKAAGQPVEWHVYADTYHAWDQPGVQYTNTNGFGQSSPYRYSATATSDSTRRMLEFFAKNQ